jgi:hypothetical protein
VFLEIALQQFTSMGSSSSVSKSAKRFLKFQWDIKTNYAHPYLVLIQLSSSVYSSILIIVGTLTQFEHSVLSGKISQDCV